MRLRELKLHLPSNKSTIFLATKLLLPREVSWRLYHICGKYEISKMYKFRKKKAKISYNLEHGAASNRALFSQETIFFAVFLE